MMAGAVGVVFVLLAIHVLHSESITVHICEGQSRSISCNAGQKMRIDRAIYGRESRGICSAHNTGNTNCRSGSASAIIRNRCQNRRSCSLHSTNGWFGDPCHGIYKYIEVRYTCITIDPCLTSYVRESNWQRSIKYNGSLNTPHHCDTAVAHRWFRFTSKAGTHMPTSCPKPYACGTEGPIWLNGNYPTQDGQQISVAVCARKKDNCCARSWSINIRKCRVGSDSFFLHRLSAAPECPMSYCAGTEIPCPPGYNSKTGYTPGCTKQYPAFTNVRMSHGVRERRLEFICEFSSNDVNETSDIFEVTWWQGAPAEQIKKTDYLRGAQRKAILRNTHKYPETPLYYLGTTISCQVRSWFEHANHTTSKFVESNHFFAGIQVLPPQLKFRISEGDKPMKLMIRNTVPIVCELFKCFVIIELGQTSSDSLLDVCSVQFEPGKANQTKEIQVVALRDFVDDGDHTMFVKFHVFDHVDPVDWNMHKKIPDVQIMSMDVGTERCTTTGDPHLTTFDKFYFHHYQVGDYVLVQSKCRKFEVHVRTWKCASVSCNCGVAAREGDDVVVVDMCRDRIPRARFASTVEPHPDTKLTRDRNGKSFEIAFPSGAFVRIDLHRWYGNLWYGNIQVQVVSDDFKCTEGLCGTFDRNKNNELKTRGGQVISGRNGAVAPTQFTESWKIPTGRSLFYYRGGPRKCKAKRVKHFCTCEERCCGKRQVNCDFKGYAKRPKYKKGKKTWKDLNFPGGKHCGRRKRRSTSDAIILPDDEGDLTDYIYDPAPIAVVTPTWPTPLGKTLAATRTLCSTRIQNSEITKVCTKELDAFDVAPFIEECITDIQVSDNNTFVMSAIEKMKHHCEEKTLKDISRWQKDPTKNNTLEPPEIIDNIICPNQCSGNGRCVNATCVCDAGFETADCSMKVGEGPVVISKWPTQFDGLCDLRKRECSRVRVSGINFIDSDQLKCRGVPAEYKDNTFEKSKGSEISRGYLLSFAEVMCELDKLPTNVDRYATGEKGRAVAGLFIDVANNGQNYSESQALYIVYDSKCMNCSLNETTCQQKDGKCLINGFCFNQGQVNPHDYCQICDPVRDMSKFSIREAHAKPVFYTKSDWTAFRGQDFKIQIEASDPENQTVSLSLYENYEGVSLFKNGTFKWKPLEVKMNLFKIIAEDRCGKKSSLTLNINATECTCGERQTCELVKNGTKDILNCLCPDGCTGPMCSEPLPGKSCAFVDRPGRAVGGDNKSKTVIISVSIGVAVLVILTAVISYCVIVRKRRQTTKKEIEKSIVYNKSEAQAKVFENDMYASTAQLT